MRFAAINVSVTNAISGIIDLSGHYLPLVGAAGSASELYRGYRQH